MISFFKPFFNDLLFIYFRVNYCWAHHNTFYIQKPSQNKIKPSKQIQNSYKSELISARNAPAIKQALIRVIPSLKSSPQRHRCQQCRGALFKRPYIRAPGLTGVKRVLPLLSRRAVPSESQMSPPTYPPLTGAEGASGDDELSALLVSWLLYCCCFIRATPGGRGIN